MQAVVILHEEKYGRKILYLIIWLSNKNKDV